MRRQSLQRVKTPARAILEAAAAVFRFYSSCSVRRKGFYSTADSRKNRLSKQKPDFVGVSLTPLPPFVKVVWTSRNTPPPLFNQTTGFVDTFRWVKKGSMRAANRANLSAKQQTPFTEHLLPSGIRAGLRAGNPKARRFWRCSARQCTCFHEGTG